MKSHIPPPWQIPGLLDGSVSAVSWPILPQPTMPKDHAVAAGVYPDWYNHTDNLAFWLKDNRMTEPRTWKCPFGKPGDVLAVKEVWRPDWRYCEDDGYKLPMVRYRIDSSTRLPGDCDNKWWKDGSLVLRWQSAGRMPLWASRLHLRVLSVRAQRCVDVTCAEAIAEGIRPTANCMTIDCDTEDPRERLQALWQPVYASRGLDWTTAWRWIAKVERVTGEAK
jgi:hypothetical protein